MRQPSSLLGMLLLALFAPPARAGQPPLRFDFGATPASGAQAVACGADGAASLYDGARGWGFTALTNARPARTVHTAGIRCTGSAAVIAEPVFEEDNHYGLAFRVKLAPGTYDIRVRATGGADDATVSISGMQTSRLLKPSSWDAAGLLSNRTLMRVDGHQWSYRYVNGQDAIDIEIEPGTAGVAAGIEALEIVPVALEERPAGARPTVFTLGDSTVKSYTFDEAPMSGWGQVFGQLFDPGRVRVLNYANGGRSYRNAYAEGRFNDLLLAGHPGDVILIQFGHNDESEDETRRWGRGATEAMVEDMLRQVYLPAIRARRMHAVLVTPMSRVNGAQKPGQPYENSFKKRRFPELLRRIAAEEGVPLADLNARSVEYYNQAGVAAVTAMVMSIEAGETPGKTNDGSYANGHPSGKIDGTHFKEAMSKQYARMVVTELDRLARGKDATTAWLAGALRPEVRTAIASGDWSAIHPEIAADIRDGDNAYYRNQIEKLIQLGALRKDAHGNFNPQAPMESREFAAALYRLLQLPASQPGYPDGALTRETMAAIVDHAYHQRFSARPAYMTEYNGKTVVPGMPGYDPNLDTGAQGAMYYPLLDWSKLADTAAIAPALAAPFEDAYRLGLIRSETGIARGRMVNGSLLQPKAVVSRAKAAKELYFMWVLAQPPKAENHTLMPQGPR